MDIKDPSDPSVAFRHPRLIPRDLSFRSSDSIIVKSAFGLSRLLPGVVVIVEELIDSSGFSKRNNRRKNSPAASSDSISSKRNLRRELFGRLTFTSG